MSSSKSTRKSKTLDFNVEEPLDINTAVKALDGNNDLYLKIVSRFEQMTLKGNMQNIKHAIDKGDWGAMNRAVGTIKGVSGVVGAGKVHYACFYIQKAYADGDPSDMVKKYPFLVEAVIDLK